MRFLDIVKVGRHNEYMRTDTDIHGKVVFERTSKVRAIESKSSGRTSYIILDSEGNSIPEVSYFLNDFLPGNGASDNTIHKAKSALEKFHAFADLMDLDITAMDEDDIHRLKKFLKGGDKGRCSNGTVNCYLGVIRAYLETRKIECDALFRRHAVAAKETSDGDFAVRNVYYVYTSNLHVESNTKVPKYITLGQYLSILGCAKKLRDWMSIILIHLMFRYGMRLGECLGLTEEDFVYMKKGGKEVPTLIVRNRLTDKRDQKAKRKITPQTKADYSDEDYIKQWKNDSYSHYYLTESDEFVITFVRFMKETREKAEKEHPENYATAEADVVDPESFKKKGLEKNHYIFVNHLGKRLSGQLWGNILKGYFNMAEIELDKGKKQNNLSHRFRHGFAMLRAHFMSPPVPVQVLKVMMHHKSIHSTMVYYNLTEEDEFEIKSQLQENMYKSFPEFENAINEFLKDM